MEQQQGRTRTLKARPVEDRSVGLWRQALRRFLRHRAGVAAGVVFLLIVAVIALGPVFLVSHDAAFRPNPLELNKPPTLQHLLGTDEVGRDILARLIYGGQISLTVGLLAMIVSITLGVLLGALSGYFGGVVDGVIMRLTDVMMSVPSLFLIIAFSVFMGPSVRTIVLAIGLLNWMGVARIVRASFLSLKEQEFVTAARSVGARSGRIMWLHILPNAVAPVVVAATLTIGSAILTETAVSYLGMGIQPPMPSWGNMLKNAQAVIWKAPWVATFPGMMIPSLPCASTLLAMPCATRWTQE